MLPVTEKETYTEVVQSLKAEVDEIKLTQARHGESINALKEGHSRLINTIDGLRIELGSGVQGMRQEMRDLFAELTTRIDGVVRQQGEEDGAREKNRYKQSANITIWLGLGGLVMIAIGWMAGQN